MTWDGDSTEERQQPTAGEYARLLQARAVSILTAAGHTTCEYLQQAKYVPESGAVVCGCGEFAPWSEDPDTPPWESSTTENDTAYRALAQDTEAADRAAQHALQQRGGTAVAEAADPIRSTLALIDPTEVYGPEDVERHILDTLYRLETGALFERETVVKAWETAQAFDLKYNACIATSTGGSADVRKAMAMNDCAGEYTAMLEAKMMKEAVKQTMHNLRAVLSGYQSTARSVGSAYQAGGSQGGPPQRDGRPW
jgi:hypothetical protein